MSQRAFNFNSISAPNVKRTAFDLSHEHTTSCAMGKLVPIEVIECLPGDSFRITPSMVTRLQALISPMMHRVDVSVNWFKVPYRLLMDDWEKFITGGADGRATPSMPYFTLDRLQRTSAHDPVSHLDIGSLADYLGLPMPYRLNESGAWEKVPEDEQSLNYKATKVSALPFKAYCKIYNDWFRDQNLQPEINLHTDENGDNDAYVSDLCELRNRAWKKDYFTSALPTPQRGSEVQVNLVGDAQVSIPQQLFSIGGAFGDAGPRFIGAGEMDNGEPFYPSQLSDSVEMVNNGETVTDITGRSSAMTGTARLSGLSVIGITALRTAFKLQQFLERNNVAGGRYIEQILAHFGVQSSDARLQRSEYLGGGSMPIVVSEVETNADSDGDVNYVVGDLAGKAKAVGGLGTIVTKCEEHCYIMGILSIMPKASYSQGLSKMWTREDKLDFFWPEFQFVGEQEILQKEVALLPQSVGENETFGYQSRYSEYKYLPNRVSGDLRTSLSYWHMGRLFNFDPHLNEDFIKCQPTDRIYAVTDQTSSQHCVCDCWFDIKALRPMSMYADPKIC